MAAIGIMAMPENFKYASVFRKGKPQHDFYDVFRIRHPKMANGKRAKIFSAFDALKGFSEAICAKEITYMDRIEPDPAGLEELNRRLTVLHALTANARMARENRIRVDVTCYEPCADAQNEAWGFRGRYRTVSGICRKVDPEACRALWVDDSVIAFEDILRIESGIFERNCTEETENSHVYEILY